VARAGSRRERERRERKDAGRSRPFPYGNRELTALHEAGHVLVGHALGRRPVYVRITPVTLPVGHPENPLDTPIVSGGFHRDEPTMSPEVKAQYEGGLPLTAEQREWLLQECIIAFGGPLAELVVNQSAIDIGMTSPASGDFLQLGNCAGMLGYLAELNGETIVAPAFQDAAEDAARSILADLMEHVVELANALLATPVMEEEQVQAALAGVPSGSHVHLVASLAGDSGPGVGQSSGQS
jgi:hypothetical protein